MVKTVRYKVTEKHCVRNEVARKQLKRMKYFEDLKSGDGLHYSKGWAYRPSPPRIVHLLPLRGSSARRGSAFVVLTGFRLSQLPWHPTHQPVLEWRPDPKQTLCRTANVAFCQSVHLRA